MGDRRAGRLGTMPTSTVSQAAHLSALSCLVMRETSQGTQVTRKGDHTSCPGDVHPSTHVREVASCTPPAIHGAIPPQLYES
jgi:hypothetical protein